MFSKSSLYHLFFLSLAAVCKGQVDEDQPEPLPGDLATLGANTKVANDIANILAQDATGQNYTKGPIPTVPGGNNTDPACFPWYGISEQLTAVFNATDGSGCTELARAAIRMAFHDAGTWSSALAKQGTKNGGADGSLYLFAEWQRPENLGLEDAVNFIGEMAQSNGVSVADMFQFAGAHGVVTCPLGPRVRTFVGRKDATEASPDNLLPSAFSDADTLVDLFLDKQISPHDLTALVGAHSSSVQTVTNLSCVGCSQDATPGIWDVQFYNSTMFDLTPEESLTQWQFPSDKSMATTGATSAEWVLFVNNNTAAGDPQDHWNEDFSAAFIRLSLTGVYNINANVIECTDALPGGIGDGQAEPPNNGDFNFDGTISPVEITAASGVTNDAAAEETFVANATENGARRRRNFIS